jgi:cell division protein FtsI (penicillin-binding protein 3)
VGLELAYDEWLRGKPGSKRIMRDGRRRILEDVEQIRAPQPGQDLVLSIDQRLQYLAYRVLKAAVIKHQAAAASLVMLDPHSGEVLAMVNQPAFNPNSTRQRLEPNYRNRALVDTFEPGSTMKPFALSAALDAGVVRPETTVSTGPGYFRVGRRMVRDHHNYGTLDVAGILQKSSNVGTAKIVLGIPSADLWGMYRRLGFGKVPGTGFPGEQAGVLRHYSQWRDIEKATLSFGYGVSTTTLHLARAYAAIANDGAMPIVSLIKRESTPPAIRVMSAQTARNVRKMLEQVVSREGTAVQAGVSGYGVAGKTGNVRKIKNGHYSTDDYQSLFVGMAPASRPRLVIAVVVDSPHGGQYYGGAVAAPLFSAVMAESLKVLGIPPDQMESPPMRVAGKDGATHVR